jgi:hypothetical protein
LSVVGFFAREIEIGFNVAAFGFEELFGVYAVFDLLALL